MRLKYRGNTEIWSKTISGCRNEVDLKLWQSLSKCFAVSPFDLLNLILLINRKLSNSNVNVMEIYYKWKSTSSQVCNNI